MTPIERRTAKTIAMRLNEPGGIAARLRTLRSDAALSGKALAEKAGWAASKVTKIEHGQQAPTADDIETWVRVCHADHAVAVSLIGSLHAVHAEHASWQRRMRSGQAVIQTAYNKLIAESRVIRCFETWVIPGLLQTPPYARRVLIEAMTLAGLDPDDVDQAVAVRMQRQQHLYDPTKQFEFLLAEPVLHWQMCPAGIMRPQLDRLHSIIGLPNVRFGIFPYRAAQAAFPQNPFQIRDDLAFVETFMGEITYRGADARTYAAILDNLWTHAIEGEAARQLITRVAA